MVSGPPGWITAAIGVGAVVAGGVVGWAAGWAYDHWVPDSAKGRAEDFVRDRLETEARAKQEQQEAIRIHEDLLREKLADNPHSPQYGWDDRQDWQGREDGA